MAGEEGILEEVMMIKLGLKGYVLYKKYFKWISTLLNLYRKAILILRNCFLIL